MILTKTLKEKSAKGFCCAECLWHTHAPKGSSYDQRAYTKKLRVEREKTHVTSCKDI